METKKPFFKFENLQEKLHQVNKKQSKVEIFVPILDENMKIKNLQNFLQNNFKNQKIKQNMNFMLGKTFLNKLKIFLKNLTLKRESPKLPYLKF